MSKKYDVEQKGNMFLVVDGSNGNVKGRHKTKGEADVQAERLQKEFDIGVSRVSGRTSIPHDNEVPEEGE